MDMPEPRFSTLPLRQMLCMGSTSEVLVRPETAANVGIKLQKRRPSRLLRKSEKSENAYPRVKTNTLEVLVFSVFAGKI